MLQLVLHRVFAVTAVCAGLALIIHVGKDCFEADSYV